MTCALRIAAAFITMAGTATAIAAIWLHYDPPAEENVLTGHLEPGDPISTTAMAGGIGLGLALAAIGITIMVLG